MYKLKFYLFKFFHWHIYVASSSVSFVHSTGDFNPIPDNIAFPWHEATCVQSANTTHFTGGFVRKDYSSGQFTGRLFIVLYMCGYGDRYILPNLFDVSSVSISEYRSIYVYTSIGNVSIICCSFDDLSCQYVHAMEYFSFVMFGQNTFLHN